MRAWPSGKASAFQADIREFESRRPLFYFNGLPFGEYPEFQENALSNKKDHEQVNGSP